LTAARAEAVSPPALPRHPPALLAAAPRRDRLRLLGFKYPDNPGADYDDTKSHTDYQRRVTVATGTAGVSNIEM
jgi:hypothetical protein